MENMFSAADNANYGIGRSMSRLASSVLNMYLGSGNEDDDEQVSPEREREMECPYPRPFLILDLIWNLGFVFVAALVLLTTFSENPSTPLRLWIAGYALLCLLHIAFLWLHHHHLDAFSFLLHHGLFKRLESASTVISTVWWVFGFFWIYMGGQPLLQDAPRLYWLSVVFLAFDVLFMIFCMAMACIVFMLLVCFLPVLARVAYVMTLRNGASESDIRMLPKFRYRNNLPELAVSLEDSECCICLHSYEDGAELCTLPCKHHFHYRCICKWLRINATCPLCKFNILRAETLV